jgi:hypothetical protein
MTLNTSFPNAVVRCHHCALAPLANRSAARRAWLAWSRSPTNWKLLCTRVR